MSEYLLSTGAVLVLIAVLVVGFLFVARRILRIAIKLAFVLAIVFAVLLTTGVGWWRGWFSPSSNTHAPVRQTNRATPTRPAR